MIYNTCVYDSQSMAGRIWLIRDFDVMGQRLRELS